MSPQEQMLATLAEVGALRAVALHAIALRVLEEPDPEMALSVIELQLTAASTVPSDEDTGLDPAMSDMLAALTDERIGMLMRDLRRRIGCMTMVKAA